MLVPVAQIEADARAEIEKNLQIAKDRVAAEIEQQKLNAQAKIEAVIPEETKIKIAEAQRKVVELKIEADRTLEPVVRAAQYAQRLSEILALADGIPPEVAFAIISDVQSSLDDARAQAAENAKAKEQ